MSEIYASRSKEIEQREIEHANLSRKLAGECMVLLENDGTLPLVNAGKVALYGNGVRKTVKGGTGSGDVNTRSNVNVEQGFLGAGYTVTSTEWLDRQEVMLEEAKSKYFAWCEEEAAQKGKPIFVIQFDSPYHDPAPILITEKDCELSDADTAVYILSRNSGEGADRFTQEGDYLLFDEEKKNLELIAKKYQKTILVLNIGGIIDLSEVEKIDGINGVLLMNQLGNIGGDALLDVLTGKVNPSGKTTDTWARDYMDYSSSEKFSHNGSVHDEEYTDGIYVGYRYFDSFFVQPQYCFGYGKSYTEFQITAKDAVLYKDTVTLKVNVKNIGMQYAGKEVVQVYAQAPWGKLEKPYQELVAFAKTSLLAPGEEETLTITFSVDRLASYSQEQAAWILEQGSYIIKIGSSSQNAQAAALIQLNKEVTLQQCKNLFAPDCELEEIRPDILKQYKEMELQKVLATLAAQEDALFELKLDADVLQTKTVTYQGTRRLYQTDKTKRLTMEDVTAGKCTIEELVAQLSIEEMAEMCVGTLRAGEGSVVGNASYTVPGAAGDSSSVIKESRGVKNMILADGPAGLRLQPHFITTKDGTLLPGGNILGDNIEPFPTDIREEEVDNYYQYCTAIPIGWALAQSWNEELVEEVGDMVGEEMEQFHVDLWLAPAMNIHRNPLCGRNFEYYSEDPLISGKIAAAMTRGVQKHSGKGTTIKHFAVNNQEDNRYFVNAHVNERALREIYLRGFEITVRESQPLSIMTSYNLLNGVHTANSHDLIQSVARDEWGFEGTIMTDWFTSQNVPFITGKYQARYPISASTGCIYAGNDMQMPGCQQNVDDIVEAVKTGKEVDGYTITLADLQFCTANIIRVVAKTQ